MAGQGFQVGCSFCSQTPVPCAVSGYTLYAFLVLLHDFQMTFVCMCHGYGHGCYEDKRYRQSDWLAWKKNRWVSTTSKRYFAWNSMEAESCHFMFTFGGTLSSRLWVHSHWWSAYTMARHHSSPLMGEGKFNWWSHTLQSALVCVQLRWRFM